MSNDERDRELLMQINQKLGELTVEVRAIQVIGNTANEARDIAKEAIQSVRSAHHRIDENDEDIKELKKSIGDVKTATSSKWESFFAKGFWLGIGAIFTYFISKLKG